MGEIFKFLGKVITGFFRGLFRGTKKLNKWQAWIGVFIAGVVCWLGTVFEENIFSLEVPIYIGWIIYICVIGMPIWYLLILGTFQSKSVQEYDKTFKDIGFVGKDGNCPVFCGKNMEGKKQILIFKSNIPLSDWKTAKGRLETAIDCTILKIENGNSKKVVKLTTLPADYKIPEMITWSDNFCNFKNGVITVGESALDKVSFDLNKVPHVLIAGETGSGKSVILRCILRQSVLQGCKVFMIDFKGGVEFGKQYEHFGEVITERERALEVLTMLVQENEYRLKIFRDLEVKNLAEYNRKTRQNLCRICVFTDELAEMLDKKGVSKEERKVYEALEGKLSTLARLSRATGINLFLGVQRPDANVLTGQIKNNIPVRISGRFADKAASEIVLGNTDAVDLPDIKGRFLYKVGNETIEFQSYYFDDETMLRDVDVEVGTMLLEAPVYHPGKKDPPLKWEDEKCEKGGTTKSKQKHNSHYTSNQMSEIENTGCAEYIEDDYELPFGDYDLPFGIAASMNVDDLDLDFNQEEKNED